MRRTTSTKVAKRQIVAERAEEYCEYCLCPVNYSPTGFSVEHITPRVAGGTDDLDNLAFACQECNNHKYQEVSGDGGG